MFLLSGLESLMTIFPVLFFFAGIVSVFVTFFPLYITFLVAVTLTTAFFTVLIVTCSHFKRQCFFRFSICFLRSIILRICSGLIFYRIIRSHRWLCSAIRI